LTRLELSGAMITDAGLVHLAKIKNLRQLALRDTKVTADGVAKLRITLPSLNVRQ